MPRGINGAAGEDMRESEVALIGESGEAAADEPATATVSDGGVDHTVPGYACDLAAGGDVEQHDQAVIVTPIGEGAGGDREDGDREQDVADESAAHVPITVEAGGA